MKYIILPSNPIKSARENLQITQKQLANELSKLLKKDIQQKHISRWEGTQVKPVKETVLALSVILKQDPLKFLSKVDEHFKVWRELWDKGKERRAS